MRIGDFVRADWEANKQNPKGRIVVVLFRMASWFRTGPAVWRVLGWPYLVGYRIVVEWVLGIELPPLTSVGPGLALHHGQGLVVNNKVVIGANCVLRHGVTLGNKGTEGSDDDCPVLEDGVVIGANAVVLGPIRVGRGAVIGAGAVVLQDVPAGAVAAGNPARIVGEGC